MAAKKIAKLTENNIVDNFLDYPHTISSTSVPTFFTKVGVDVFVVEESKPTNKKKF
jgi:hypothetical protein